MKSSHILSALAITTLATGSVAAQAADSVRASEAYTEENAASDNTVLWVVLGVVAVIGLILLLDGGDNDPVSA
jgi:cell division protein FtsW (lipid II flippase)